jgi:DNA modification methylase
MGEANVASTKISSIVRDKTADVKLSDIVIDKDFMMRDGLDKETIALYKENLENIVASDPIVLFETPKGLMLVDGFHRFKAAKQLNWESIPAEVRSGSVQDAYAYACTANLKHGKPLKKNERKKAISEYIKLNVKFSDGKIAKAIDYVVSDDTIRLYRKELEAAREIEPQETHLGADGKERTLPTSENSEVDPFDNWFKNHVVCDDMFNALPDDPLKYDLIIVDPPYGITSEEWDKTTKYDLLNSTRRWLNLVLQKLKPTGRLFVFWSREHLFELKPLLDEIKNEYPLNFGGLIVWNFRNTLSIPNNRKELKITWEPIFYFYGLDAPDLNRPDTELTGEKWTNETDSDVWSFAVPQTNFSDKKIHPAQKPLELYKHIIKLSTKTNDLILDPFAGSGTTGHAAYELGREFKLVEKNLDYVEQMRSRLKEVFHNGK